MEIINWSFITTSCLNGVEHPEPVRPYIPENYQPFKNLSKEVVRSRKGVTYLKCPAHTDFLKNTFIFCAPFDLTIDLEVDAETDLVKVYCENISQEVFNTIIDTRFLFAQENGRNPYPLLGVDWLPIFTATESTIIEIMPAFMHYNDFTKKTSVIPGEYDISKWTRPVELVFEVKNSKERIVIKKGDALSYIKFRREDQVKLVKQDPPWGEMIVCNELRQNNPFRPLKERYAELDSVRTGKCPFPHNEKGL